MISLWQCVTNLTKLKVKGIDICAHTPHMYIIKLQPDSHYIRYTAVSVLKSTTLRTPEGHWLRVHGK